MGHVRLGRLPQTRNWRDVVGLLGAAAPADRVAAASARAAEGSIGRAASDPALTHAIWLLTQLPLAARAQDFPGALRGLGLDIDRSPTLLGAVGAFTMRLTAKQLGSAFRLSGIAQDRLRAQAPERLQWLSGRYLRQCRGTARRPGDEAAPPASGRREAER